MTPTRPIIIKDPFRGAPVGESRRNRQCVVMGVRMAAELPAPEVIEPNVFDLRLRIWETERVAAAKRGDRKAFVTLTRLIARAEVDV